MAIDGIEAKHQLELVATEWRRHCDSINAHPRKTAKANQWILDKEKKYQQGAGKDTNKHKDSL
jgi:rRNA pseudouridine-1189 N-methylase Emg1 (Nep1/Mra1 family)